MGADTVSHDLDEPLLVGDYELFRVLGEGGVATTFLGRDLGNGRLVAVKALQLVRDKHRQQIALFEREAIALRALSHPQIPAFFGTRVREGAETFTLYLVQEFVQGRSLARMLDDGHRFGEAEVVELLLSCLDPLAYLHAQTPPLFHRDLKPSNIIRKADGTCVLIDFGAVREALANPRDAGSSVVGTFGYMAPEQFQGRASAPTDLYSLGATALHLLSGRSPKSFDVKRLKPDFHSSVELDPHLAAILDLLLEPVDEDRYQSAASLRRALERWKAEQLPAPTPPAPPAAEPLVTSSVTRSPIIFVSGEQPAAHTGVPVRPPRANPTPEPAPRAEHERDTPRALEAVGNQAMLLPAIFDPNDQDDEGAPVPKAAAASAGAAAGRPHTGPTRRAPSSYPGAAATGSAEIPIARSHDRWWHALYPPARGYTQVGFVFLVLAAMLFVIWRVRGLGSFPLIVAALLVAFGLSYFVLDWLRERKNRPHGLLGNADGRLARVDLTTTVLGERYITIHYEFRVEDRRYLGRRTFPSREAAQPFLRAQLDKRVWYDEEQPERSTLDVL